MRGWLRSDGRKGKQVGGETGKRDRAEVMGEQRRGGKRRGEGQRETIRDTAEQRRPSSPARPGGGLAQPPARAPLRSARGAPEGGRLARVATGRELLYRFAEEAL